MSEEKGKIIIIKRNGQDRVSYPLMSNSCLFGSGMYCDIRVQLPSVSERHCVFKVGPKDKVYLSSLSPGNITLLNNAPVSKPVPVHHKDILTVVDRCFRFEYPPDSAHYVPDDSPLSVPEVKSLKIVSPREKPPVSNYVKVNGTPGKTQSSAQKKAARKSLDSAKTFIFGDEVSPLSRPNKTYGKKRSPSPRSLTLSAKAKRVSFGPALSPEQFDKTLPPATPVRRGSLPRRHAGTPDYFGSPVIMQYARPKKNRLSAVPREQSIVEETPEEANQSPSNSCGVPISPKSRSPSVTNKQSPKIKGSPVPQQEPSKTSPGITRKSPLAKKSPKSTSPKQKLASPRGKSKPKPNDSEPELLMPLSDSPVSLPSSPKQTVGKSHKNSPVKSQQKTPKDKGSPSKLSPPKVWASAVSPSSKHASPLSRRKSSLHSTENSSSAASTPNQSLKNQKNDKKLSSSGKKLPGARALKRLSSGKSPARPVTLTTPSQKSSPKTPKTSSVSKLQYSLSLTQHASLKEGSRRKMLFEEISFSENQYSTDGVGNFISSDPVTDSNSDVKTPKSSPKRQLGHIKLSSKKVSPSPRVLKRLSAGKSPARSLSLTSPTRSIPRKDVKTPTSSSKFRSSLPFVSNSSAKKASESKISPTKDLPSSTSEGNISQSSVSDETLDSQLTPANRRRSKLHVTPKSSGRQPNSPLKQNPPVNTILTPVMGEEKDYNEVVNTTPVSARRQSQSPMTPKSAKKQVGSSLKTTGLVSPTKTPGSKRKSDVAVVSEPTKKNRLSASPSPKLNTPTSSRASPRLQSTPAPVEARSAMSPKELLPKASPSTVKTGRNTPATKSPALSLSTNKESSNAKPASALKSKKETPLKMSPKVRSLTSPPKSKAKTPNRTSTGSKFTPSPAKLVTSKPSPKVKSTSTPAKLKQSTPAKKITSAAKSSVKKTASTSKSLKKPGSSTVSRVVRSPAKSVKKAFSIKKSSKKPLWTEVVRKGIMNKKVTVKPKVVCSLLSRALKKKVLTSATRRNLLKKSVPTPHKRVVALMSTGHANSPETIIIQKRSTSSRASRSRRSLSAVQPQTPGFLVTARTPSTAGKLSLTNSSAKSSRTSSAGKRKSLLGKQKSSPNLSSVLTPNISQERFVSPLTTPRFSSRNNSFLEKYVLENQLLMTPGMGETPPIKTTRKSETVDGVKRLQKARTPKADYSNVAGVKRLVQTPRDTPKADYRDVRGIKRIVQTPRDSPKADYRDVRGIKRLVQTPKDSPKADYSNVAGIKNLLKTPASAKRAVSRAKTVSIKQLYLKSSPQSDYTKVTGVKQLFQAVGRVKGKPPARKAKDKELGKEPDFTHVEGVKQLFREPEENEFNISGLQQLFSPVPSMSYDTTPVTQETPPVQAASSPKSRRKQSFNSPVSVTNLSNSNKKPARMTSPVPQKMVTESEKTDGKAILVASSPRSSSRESLKSPVGHLVAEAPDSASKASRPTRSVNAALAPEQPQHAARSPSVRKSGGTVVPLDTPSSKSDKIQKLSTPAKGAVSLLSPVLNEGSPSLNVTPKTRQRTPAKGSVDRKSSQSPKRSIGKGVKLNVETSGNEPASAEVPKDVKKGTPVSTPQRTRRGTRPTDDKETPEVIVPDDDDDSQHDTPVGRRQITRGGRSAGATAKPKAASKKGSKRSANQGTSDSALDEVQQMVDKEIITTNSPAPSFSSTGKVSPQKISRAPRNKKQPAEEVLEKENVPTDTLPKGGRATRNKKVEGDHRDAAVETPQKGVRSTRGKKGAIEEIAIDHQGSTDLSKKGGRATRGQKVLDQGPAENSSAAPVVSSPRIGKRIKSKGILDKETTDNSWGLSENDVEILEVIEVKGSKRTRGRGTPVQNKSPTASQSIVPQNDEPAAGKGGSRQTRSRNNPSTEVDSSELSHNKGVSRKDRPLRSRDLVNQSPLPSQESVETPTEGRRVNKRGQGNLTSDANETPGSVKQPRSRRRDQDSVPSTPGDSGATGNKATPEVAATPEKRSGRSKKLLAKADDVVPSTVVMVKDAPNTPVMSKGARNRRNQKTSDTVPQADKEIETSHEVDSVPTVTRRPRRGRQQDSETVLSEAPAQQSRTRKRQTNVSSAETGDITVDSTGVSDPLPRSRRGKTTKTDVPDEKIEVPAAKRPKKQSKKSSVDEGENSLGHADVNEAAPSRRSQSKRTAADSIDDETSPKRAKKGANTSKKSSSAVKKGSKATKVKSTPVKTRSPILEVIPEVDEDAAVTPVAVSRTTRMKASDKQLTKEPAVRRPTRSRRK